jgi:site-specific recombinase XerD
VLVIAQRPRTRRIGVARAASPTEALLARFGHYVLAERGLAAGTVRGYVSHARRFVDELSSIGALAQVTAAEVTEAVLHESTVVSVGCAAHYAAMGVAAVAWSAEDRTAARKERDD